MPWDVHIDIIQRMHKIIFDYSVRVYSTLWMEERREGGREGGREGRREGGRGRKRVTTESLKHK